MFPKIKGQARLSESSGLTLGLEEGKDVVSLDGALDVADDGSAGLVHELDADLDDTTARASTAEDFSNLLMCKRRNVCKRAKRSETCECYCCHGLVKKTPPRRNPLPLQNRSMS